MLWAHNTRTNTYTLTVDDGHCRVWHTTRNTWSAVVSNHGIVTTASNFDTADAAKAWCEEQVAKAR